MRKEEEERGRCRKKMREEIPVVGAKSAIISLVDHLRQIDSEENLVQDSLVLDALQSIDDSSLPKKSVRERDEIREGTTHHTSSPRPVWNLLILELIVSTSFLPSSDLAGIRSRGASISASSTSVVAFSSEVSRASLRDRKRSMQECSEKSPNLLTVALSEYEIIWR